LYDHDEVKLTTTSMSTSTQKPESTLGLETQSNIDASNPDIQKIVAKSYLCESSEDSGMVSSSNLCINKSNDDDYYDDLSSKTKIIDNEESGFALQLQESKSYGDDRHGILRSTKIFSLRIIRRFWHGIMFKLIQR